ncbi:hypothetical protein Pcinc_024734 [Petrolisthes cinctipes]|nr:hypothetical protein Pcinc_024734 [Petrolisthes cinctipes]
MSTLVRRLSTCVQHHSRRTSIGTPELSTSPGATSKFPLPDDDDDDDFLPTSLLYPQASPQKFDPLPFINSSSPRQLESSPVQLSSSLVVGKSYLPVYSSPFKYVNETSAHLTPGTWVPPNEVRRSSETSTTHLKWTTPSQEKRSSLDVTWLAEFNVSHESPSTSTQTSVR